MSELSSYKTSRQTFHTESLPLFVIFLSLIALVLFASCSKSTREEQAAEAAKTYYDHLANGRDQEYVDGLYGSDTIHEDYRRELCDNARQYVKSVEQSRGGIIDIRTLRTVNDTASHTVNVFLMICFGDSVNEQVVVPMTEHNGRWVIR